MESAAAVAGVTTRLYPNTQPGEPARFAPHPARTAVVLIRKAAGKVAAFMRESVADGHVCMRKKTPMRLEYSYELINQS